ncbi:MULTISPECIES: alpha/beta hydrolase [unclassified Sphingomonas]|uniref:alpha/beta hydrolase n=1 Tax=unclassified Sphingomonas TaxID=196159 RepID=UPI00226AE655|nr:MULTISPECIES: alpha/beta hydrolase [unclassified Sphingomonas]
MPLAANPDRFAIVTISDADALPPWQALFGWPGASEVMIAADIRSSAERRAWAARLDQVVHRADRSILLVVDGIGCAAAAWWARLSPAHDVARIGGAIFFPGAAVAADPAKLFASPGSRLPFPSLVIHPRDDAAAADRAIASWGSRIVSCRRERDRASSLGSWQQAQRLFLRLTGHVVDHDLARAGVLPFARS